jgi:Protein of unknown function (DUF2568)
MKTANLALKFLLELGALAAFAYWGAATWAGAAAIAAAVAAPVVMAVVWGVFAAPTARRRLSLAARVPLELTVFGLAVAALAVAGSGTVAAVFGAAVAVNAVLLTVFRQWED